MILSLAQVLWSALAAIGLQFVVLQWRLKDAGQRDFAISIGAMVAASAAETWNPAWSRPWVHAATEAGFLWALVFAVRLAGRNRSLDKALRPAAYVLAGLGTAMAVQGSQAGPGWILAWPMRITLAAQVALFAYAGLRNGPIASAGESVEGLIRRLLAASYLALAVAALLSAGRFAGPIGFLLPALLYAGLGMTAMWAGIADLDRRNRESLASLDSAYSRLRDATRLEELGASAAFISEEIKSHVHAMKGSASLLRTGAGEDAHEVLRDLGGTVNRLETLASDIAVYAAAPSRARPSRLGLARISRQCAQALASGDCAFHVHASGQRTGGGTGEGTEDGTEDGTDDGTEIDGDSGKLEQVFLNLFKNSREAGARVVDIRFIAWGDRLVVTVEDDGCGCRPEELSRIFRPFVTGKADSGGSGLGTTITERLLAGQGATIRAYTKNALGMGAGVGAGTGAGTGLRIDMVFARPGHARGSAPGFAVLARDPDCAEAITRPLANLGLGSRMFPFPIGREPPIPADTWFLFEAGFGTGFGTGKEGFPAPSTGPMAWSIGADRVARPLVSGTPFLFAEGEIAARLRAGSAA